MSLDIIAIKNPFLLSNRLELWNEADVSKFIMNSLSQNIFRKCLNFLLSIDRKFREDFTNFLFEFHESDDEVEESVIEHITGQLAGNLWTGIFPKWLVKQELNTMVTDEKIVPLIRVMRMSEKLRGSANIDRNLWARHFQNSVFSSNTGIDYLRISKATFDLSKSELFDNLTDEQLTVLKQLPPKELDVLSNFTQRGIRILLNIARLPHRDKSFLLLLEPEESDLIRDFQYENIHLLSKLDEVSRNEFLSYTSTDSKKFQVIFEWIKLDKNNAQKLLDKISKLSSDQRIILKTLLDEKNESIKNLHILEGVDELLENIARLTDREREMLCFLPEQRYDLLKNLNVSEKKILEGFDDRVLNLASTLTETELDQLLLFPKGAFREITSDAFGQRLHNLAYILPDGDPISPRIERLDQKEETALKSLNEKQRAVLAEVHNLPSCAVKMLMGMNLDRVSRVMNAIKNSKNGNFQLDHEEQLLKKRIEDLPPEKRYDIVYMTEEEWNEFHSIRGFDDQTCKVLTELSRPGIDVLKAITSFNKEQLKFINEISKTGLAVLAGNSKLTVTTVHPMMQLNNEEEQSFLMNLSLKTRYLIETNDPYKEGLPHEMDTLSPDGQRILTELVKTNNKEAAWTRLMNFDKKTEFTTHQAKLWTYLNKNNAQVFADLIDSNNKSVFNLWTLLFDVKGKEDVLYANFQTEVSKILRLYSGNGAKFLANVIATTRFQGDKGLEVLHRSRDLNESFFMELLRLSVEDGISKEQSLKIVEEMNKKGFAYKDLAKVHDYSDRRLIEFFKWILINSAEDRNDLLYKVARIILVDRLNQRSSLDFGQILNSSTEELVGALRRQFTDNEFELAKWLFFDLGNKHVNAVWLSKILDNEQCIDLLKSEIYLNNHGISHLFEKSGVRRNIFTIRSTDRVEFLDAVAYYDYGDVIPLLDKLPNMVILNFFNADSRRKFLLSNLSNGRHGLLKFLRQRLYSGDMKGILEKEKYHVVRSFVNEIKSIEHAENLATTLNMLYETDSTIPQNYYIEASSKLILSAQKFAASTQPEKAASIARSLINDKTNLDNLITPIMSELDSSVKNRIFETTTHGCNPRKKREDAYLTCIDSWSRQEESEAAEALDIINVKPTKDVTFYHDLLKFAKLLSSDGSVDPGFRRSFVQKVKNIDLNSLSPNIRKVVENMKENLDIHVWRDELTRAEVVERISKTADTVGFGFTTFLLSQHLANKDVQGLGYDALNFWILPKIGEKIAETVSRSESAFFKNIASTLGGGVKNLLAFVGLEEAIAARMQSKNRLDKNMANLHIASNLIYIVVDLPAIIANIEIGTIAPILVADLVGTYFWEAKLKADSLRDHLKLTNEERGSSFWSFSGNNRQPQSMTCDLEARLVLEQYITRVMDTFKTQYNRIGLSLPRWIIGKIKSPLKTISLMPKLVFDRRAVVRDPFEGVVPSNSTLIPERVENYTLVCSPSAKDIEVEVVEPSNLSGVSTEKYRIHGQVDDRCQNMVLYEKVRSSKSNTILYVAQDYFSWESSENHFLDVIFFGRDISVVNTGTQGVSGSASNRYALMNNLSTCKIHKKGLNYIHTKENVLTCDLDGLNNGQENVIFINGIFTDSDNVHSVIGNEKKNKITVSHARFVDGKDGHDFIKAGNSTVVQGYFGDLIIGEAIVILRGNIDQIVNITIERSTLKIFNDNGAVMELDKNCKFMSADGYFVVPIQKCDKVSDLRLHRVSRVDFGLELELAQLRNTKNDNFKLIKQVSSPHYDIILTQINANVFTMDKNSHNYYWEGPINEKQLYMLTQPEGNVTISRMNGILDFVRLNITINDIVPRRATERGIIIDIDGLHVTLLPNYKSVAVTVDGKSYYKLENGKLVDDFCSHAFQVEGKMSINPSELIGRHNCFDFNSDKVYFINSKGNLILVSGKGALVVHNYYSSIREICDISLKLISHTITPDEFRKKADNPNTIKYYPVNERGVQIYHNQPQNKQEIGVIDLREWSIMECGLRISANTLFLSLRNDTRLKIENWATEPTTRDMIFSFKNQTFLNKACILSNCHSEDILEELETVQSQRSKRKRDIESMTYNQRTNISPMKLLPSMPDYQFHAKFCTMENFGVLFFLFQSFLDRIYPRFTKSTIVPGEILVNACNIAQIFEEILKKTAQEFRITVVGVDFFEVYSEVADLMRKGEYSQILKTLYSIVESVGRSDKTFLSVMKQNLLEILNSRS